MSTSTAYFIVAALLALIIPIVPKILAMRIWLFNKFGWKKIADWHELGARPIIITVRLVFLLASIACVSRGLGWI